MIVMQVVRLLSHVGIELNESLAPCRSPLPQRDVAVGQRGVCPGGFGDFWDA
jgi:hypothetical protein